MSAGPSEGTIAANPRTLYLFSALLAASLVWWWQPLSTTLRLALENIAYTHLFLIVPLSVALIWLERDALRPPFQASVRAGAFLLVTALLMTVVAKWDAALPGDLRLSLSMLALVLWWFGGVVLCFGTKVFRSLLFPLCFLVWMVPLPETPLNWTIEWLQVQSATTARILFWMARVPVTQDGIMVSIPGLDIEVASQCSSIRSSLMLVITTMVLSHLLLHSWWRKVLLVAVAIPLSFVKNGFRIFVISELGTRIDPSFFEGRLHHHGGILFLGIAIGVVALLLWVLRRTEAPNPQKLVLSPVPE
jgi:exosortase